nr:WAT1-related protein At2g39510-like [Tanacetum cinerariifolium]
MPSVNTLDFTVNSVEIPTMYQILESHVIMLNSYPVELSLAALIYAAGSLQKGIATMISKRGDTSAEIT